ncbi:kinase-like domain-containing protein [Xylariaceae sp. FL0255]|nr:kinase-like domain-containing protein [Xylariaceae sp. FL0255]
MSHREDKISHKEQRSMASSRRLSSCKSEATEDAISEKPSNIPPENNIFGSAASEESGEIGISSKALKAFVAAVQSAETADKSTDMKRSLSFEGSMTDATIPNEEIEHDTESKIEHAIDQIQNVIKDKEDSAELGKTLKDTNGLPANFTSTVEINTETTSEANLDSPEDGTQEYNFNYVWLEEFEDIRLYNKDGFHPIHIDDILDERFEVVHKLGYGGSGTVWLCRDLKLKKWRAVKVMTAKYSRLSREQTVLDLLKKTSTPDELEQNHIAAPLESFWIDGPNGRHLCHVMYLYGEQVNFWRARLDSSKEETTKYTTEACGQIVQALAFLHGKGICHGDLRPGNLLMRLDQEEIDKLDKDQMNELIKEPEAWEVETKSGKDPRPIGPEYLVMIAGDWCQKFTTNDVMISDFGESFHMSDPREWIGIPETYGPPECLFRLPINLSADLWSLACTLYSLRTRSELFGHGWHGDTPEMVSEMELLLGPLPQPYRATWYREGFGNADLETENISPDESEPVSTRSLDEMKSEWKLNKEISGYDQTLEALVGEQRTHCFPDQDSVDWQISREEVIEFTDLLKRLLKYTPGERGSAETILGHAWLKDTKFAKPAHTPEAEPVHKPLPSECSVSLKTAIMLVLLAIVIAMFGVGPNMSAHTSESAVYSSQVQHRSLLTGQEEVVPLECTCEIRNVFSQHQQCAPK